MTPTTRPIPNKHKYHRPDFHKTDVYQHYAADHMRSSATRRRLAMRRSANTMRQLISTVAAVLYCRKQDLRSKEDLLLPERLFNS
jgi:hypothetical protein